MRLLVLTAALLALTACDVAGRDEAPVQATAEATAASGRTAAQQAFAKANNRMHAAMAEIPADPDEAFMRGMLAHHRGAVEMAEVELAHGQDEQARGLAQRIIDAQQVEIAEMEAWLADRDVSITPATMAPNMDHSAH